MYFFGIVQKHTIAKGETLAIKGEFPKRPINVLLVFVTASVKNKRHEVIVPLY